MVILIKLVVIILGVFMVPIALACEAYRTEFNKYKGNNGQPVYIFTWAIMAPWQNYSDGFYCTTYFNYGFFWTSFMWSCVRNTASGLRWLPVYTCKIDPEKIRYVGSYSKYGVQLYKNNQEAHWWFAWQGLYSCLCLQINFWGELRRFWIGYKITPKDTRGIDPTDYRVDGAAPTIQFKRLK